MQELVKQLWQYLRADAEHRGSAVQEIHIGRSGELRVELVDKVRVAELLSKIMDTSALYPADRASVSRPCEDTQELQTILSILTKYEKRKTEEERVREP